VSEPWPVLALAQVDKRFGGLRVIDNLSFEVLAGDRLALIGPNGAGKTTVFNLITGVYPVDGGRISLSGVEITRLARRKRIRRGLARTFQNIRLMPHLSALENVMIGQSARHSSVAGMLQPVNLLPRNRWKREALQALEQAGLADFASRACGTLPYGIQKRVEVVRAVIARPSVLLLDEPAAGLSSGETEAMRTQLEAIAAGGVTLIVVEHDMHFVSAFCRRVIVLDFGCKIADCSPSEAQADPRVREIYLGSEPDDEPPSKKVRRRAARNR
jgi:branched-chain amino acid transport system ATP-binding protein